MSADEPPAEERRGFLARLRARLNSGGASIARDLRNLFRGRKIDAAVLEDLEARLLTADVGVEATNDILGRSRIAASPGTNSTTSMRCSARSRRA